MKTLTFAPSFRRALSFFALIMGMEQFHFAFALDNSVTTDQSATPPASLQTQSPVESAPASSPQSSASTDSDCIDDYDNAVTACTTANTAAGQTQQQQAVSQQQQASVNQANQNVAQSGSNQALQCLNQANLGQALAGLSAGKGQQCAAMISQCSDSCSAVANSYKSGLNGKSVDLLKAKRFQRKSDTCDSLSPNAGAAMSQAAGLLSGMLSSLACAEANSTALPTPVAVMDCTNSTYAATSILCLCARDPKNAMCAARIQFPVGANTSTGNTGPSTPGIGLNSPSTGGYVAGTAQAKPDSARGSAVTADGGSGGPQSSGRGGANAANEGGGNGNSSSVDRGVITGTMASSGGGAAGGGLIGGGGGGGALGGGGKNAAGGFDLSKYLPKAATRGIAGMSISAKDGVTGPLGPSIWEKVSNQYQLQKPNLIPEPQ